VARKKGERRKGEKEAPEQAVPLIPQRKRKPESLFPSKKKKEGKGKRKRRGGKTAAIGFS